MQAQIKTKEMLKLLDPAREGVFYEDKQVAVNWEEFEAYIQTPRKMKIFQVSEDPRVNLYRNLALYIINAQEGHRAVAINLNCHNVIEQGLFEYLKNIYNKEEKLFINISEDGDNGLFIKTKKLKPLDEQHPLAQDVRMADLQAVFVAIKSTQSKANKGNQQNIVENGRFSWKEDSADRYANADFVLENLSKILKYEQNRRQEEKTREFHAFIEKVNADLLKKEDFHLQLMELDNSFLNEWMLGEAGTKVLKLNMGKKSFQDHLFQQVKQGKFGFLEKAFEKYMTQVHEANRQYYNKTPAPLPPIDFARFLNEPEIIEFLVKKYHYEGSFSHSSDKELNVVTAYQFFNDQNKEDDAVLNKYFTCITSKSSHGSTNVNEAALFKLPFHLFNRPEILKRFLPHVSIEKFAQALKERNTTNELLCDKQFILQTAPSLKAYCIREILMLFHDKQSIDKKYVMDMLSVKPDMFDQFFGRGKESGYSSRIENGFVNFEADLSIIMHAHKHGLKLQDIRMESMKPYLLENDADLKKERFKLKYLLHHSVIGSKGHYVYHDSQQAKAFNEKYHRLEYLYFKHERQYSAPQGRAKLASRIKTLDDLNDFLAKVDALDQACEFDAQGLYNELPAKLQSNLAVVEKLGSYGSLSYKNLSESLQYNKKVALEFIARDQDSISYVPVEFFNDIDFSLAFAKIMDSYHDEEKIPMFITKFFENQGVTSNFHDYLQTYIEANSLRSLLPVNNTPVKKKKL